MIDATELPQGAVRYEMLGRGPISVVCLHGNSSSSESFWALANLLADKFTFYLLDFPGHGGSGRGESFLSSYSFKGLRSVLLSWLDKTGLRPEGIIGHSMGGHIAAQAAPDVPSLKFLVLLSSPPIAGAEGVDRFFQPTAPTEAIFQEELSAGEARDLSLAFTHPSLEASKLAAVEDWIRETDGTFRRALGRSLREALVADEVEALAEVPHVELLLIGGQSDRFIRRDYFEWVRERLALAERDLLLLPNVGHCPHLEAPEATARAIAERFGPCCSRASRQANSAGS